MMRAEVWNHIPTPGCAPHDRFENMLGRMVCEAATSRVAHPATTLCPYCDTALYRLVTTGRIGVIRRLLAPPRYEAVPIPDTHEVLICRVCETGWSQPKESA